MGLDGITQTLKSIVLNQSLVTPINHQLMSKGPLFIKVKKLILIMVEDKITFEYSVTYGPVSVMNDDGNTLKIVGDFGYFIYNED